MWKVWYNCLLADRISSIEACLDHRVIVYAVDTSRGPGFICVPPLTISSAEIDLLVERLVPALTATTKRVMAVELSDEVM